MEQETELTGRRLERAEALQNAELVLASDWALEPNTVADALARLVAAVQPKPRSTGPRVPLEKADPDEVRAYFETTGLTRKQLAAAAQVTTSVISTVQNPKGDRWSVQTFEEKRGLIDAWMVEHADEIEAARQADAAAAKARADKEAERAAKKAARAAASQPAPKKTKAADLQKGQTVTVKPRRRRTATPQSQAVATA